jgi:hypothetical protein
MTATVALFKAFFSAFMVGLGVGVALGFVPRLIKSILDITD